MMFLFLLTMNSQFSKNKKSSVFVYLEKEERVTNAEANKEVSPDQESTKSESPLPQQQQEQTVEKDASRPARKRKKVMKSKTFMNDEGYMGRCPVPN